MNIKSEIYKIVEGLDPSLPEEQGLGQLLLMLCPAIGDIKMLDIIRKHNKDFLSILQEEAQA